MLNKYLKTSPSRSVLLIRLITGVVFLSEGIQKFLFVESLGTGRFMKIGMPFPGFLSPLVGSLEIICGLLVLAGLMTRLASIPLLLIISVAILTTKIPILIHQGLWPVLHESRTDWSMLMGNLFLIINGGGRWSLDFKMTSQSGNGT